MTSPVDHERRVAADLARKAAISAPAILLIAGLARGLDGAISALVALALVSVNFAVSAALIARAAPLGPTAIAAATMGGFVARYAALIGAIVALRTQAWIDLPVLLVVLASTHLVLLFWEMRAVSLTAAYPGLHPKRQVPLNDEES